MSLVWPFGHIENGVSSSGSSIFVTRSRVSEVGKRRKWCNAPAAANRKSGAMNKAKGIRPDFAKRSQSATVPSGRSQARQGAVEHTPPAIADVMRKAGSGKSDVNTVTNESTERGRAVHCSVSFSNRSCTLGVVKLVFSRICMDKVGKLGILFINFSFACKKIHLFTCNN